jgi:hypothetical protein
VNCTDAWDCDHKDKQDWKKEGSWYYLFYNGSDFFGCVRQDPNGFDYGPGDNFWQLSIARSPSPLGLYPEQLPAALRVPAERRDACGISYDVLNLVGGELWMYYAYYPAAGGNRMMRSKLVWN